MDIIIDWKKIETEDGFFDMFLSQVDAPEWHGRNLNALGDSIVTGDINGVEPPYIIRNVNVDIIPKNLMGFQSAVFAIFDEARKAGRDIDVLHK